MRPQLSASSCASCFDCPPRALHQRGLLALAVFGSSVGGILLWRALLVHTGDALVAAMFVALVALMLVVPMEKLLRS